MGADFDWSNLGRSTINDLIEMFAGELLGQGSARKVYRCKLDPSLVFKVEDVAGSFQNIHEMDVWNEVRGTALAKWFAPCVAISATGIVLLQKATQPFDPGTRAVQLPNFFTDLKPENFGLMGKQIVAHDYGLNLLRAHALRTSRIRTVKHSVWRKSGE